MSVNKVREYLSKYNREKDILEMGESTATVQLAADALGVIPARIAKTIALQGKEDDEYVILVTAGDSRLDNRKFREQFGVKPKMLSLEKTKEITGFEVGGVCPFALPDELNVSFDISLKRFESVYPACGSANSAIEMQMYQLEETVPSYIWVDACKDWNENLK